jgi:hypothetical protein
MISWPSTGKDRRGRRRSIDWWLQSVDWDSQGWGTDVYRVWTETAKDEELMCTECGLRQSRMRNWCVQSVDWDSQRWGTDLYRVWTETVNNEELMCTEKKVLAMNVWVSVALLVFWFFETVCHNSLCELPCCSNISTLPCFSHCLVG